MSLWKHLSSDCCWRWSRFYFGGAYKKGRGARVMDEYLRDLRLISRLPFGLNDRGI